MLMYGDCYNAIEGAFVWEPSPSNRTNDFIAATRFSFQKAMEFAEIAEKDFAEKTAR